MQALTAKAAPSDDACSNGQRLSYTSKHSAGQPGDAEGQSCSWKGCPSFSEEQLEKMGALKDQFLDSVQPKMGQLMLLKRHLSTELCKKDVDKAAVLQIQSQINAIKADLGNARVNYQLDKLALLTPEQKEMFQRHMLFKHAFGRSHHRGSGFGPHSGTGMRPHSGPSHGEEELREGMQPAGEPFEAENFAPENIRPELLQEATPAPMEEISELF